MPRPVKLPRQGPRTVPSNGLDRSLVRWHPCHEPCPQCPDPVVPRRGLTLRTTLDRAGTTRREPLDTAPLLQG